MGNTLVSVVIPARDAESTIERALSSCLTQDYRGDFEVIVVDDGSVDGTWPLIENYLADERVRWARNASPEGVVGALQRGMALAKGELIMRMDADDWCSRDRMRHQVEALEENPDWCAVKCPVQLEQPQGEGMQRYVDWVNALVTPEDVSRERFVESPVIQPAVMFWRKDYDRVGGYREMPWGEDYDLWMRLLAEGGQIGSCPGGLLHWLDRPDCLTRSDEHYSQQAFLKLKAHFLATMPLVMRRAVAIGAAGPIGKAIARYLQAEGAKVVAFYDVHPRRVGNVIGGVSVLAIDEPILKTRPVLLGAAGVEGGRNQLRTWATDRGWTEGEDFWCVC